MTPATRRLGSYLLAIGLMVGGAAALAITLKINYHFGSGLAVTEQGAQLQGWSSLVVDVMAALLAIVTGALMRLKHRWMGMGALILTVAFGAYSLTSAVGFGAAERLSLAESRRVAVADAKANAQTAEKARIAYVEWLKRTATSRPKDAKGLLEVTSAEIDKLSQTKAAVVPSLLPDAQAAAFAHLTSIDQERIQIWLVVALAALLVTAKVVGFSFGAYLWPSTPAPAPAPVSQKTTPATPAETKMVDMAGERHRRVVARFLAEETKPTTNGRLTSTDVYNAFRRWVSTENISGAPTQTMFGRICGELGVPRTHSGGVIRYPSISINGVRKDLPVIKVA